MKTYRVQVTISDSDGGFVETIIRVARNHAVAMALVLALPDVMQILNCEEMA